MPADSTPGPAESGWKSALGPLLSPRSIAIIGASENSPRSRAIFRNLTAVGYRGKIFPVHPSHDEVFGLKAYPRVLDIPEAADAFVIAIRRDHVIPALEQCAQKGLRAGVIVSAGFAEASEEGKELQQSIREIAEKAQIRLCGPNSFGIANFHGKTAMLLGEDVLHVRPGNVGLIFQSGGLLNLFLLAAWDRGWGLSYAISCGNEAVLNAVDYAEYLLRDERTSLLAILTEGIRDPKGFLRVVEAAIGMRKPIVILKIGRSEKGRRAALAHTGTMVGSDAVYEAIFKQNGVIRAEDLDDLSETIELFSKRKPLKGPRLGMIVPSGAECGLVADLAQETGMVMPEFSPATRERLSKVQSGFLSVGNPLNAPERYSRNREVFKECIDALTTDDQLDIVGLRLPLPRMREDPDVIDRFRDVAEAARNTDKLVVLFSRASVSLPDYWRRLLRENTVPFLLEYRKGFKALSSLIRYERFSSRRPTAVACPHDFGQAAERCRGLLKRSNREVLTEREGKEILALYGIPVARESLATSIEEAVEAAQQIGYPVALKVESPHLAHKTDAGGVRLNVGDNAALAAGYKEIMTSVRRHDPRAEIHGVIVQEMVGPGDEVIIGMSRDPAWGPAIAVGVGGVFVEVIRDIAVRVAPFGPQDVEEMLEEVKGFQILRGARGRAEADIEALSDILLRFSELSYGLQELVEEIDINPLIVLPRGQGAKAVDCMIRRRRDDGS